MVITMLLNGRLKGIENSSLSSTCLVCLYGNINKSRIIVCILGFLYKKPDIFKDEENTLKIIGECM